MTSVRLALQTVLVLGMVGFVSLSNHARTPGADAAARQNGESGRVSESRAGSHVQAASGSGPSHAIGYGSMSIQRATTASAGPWRQTLLEPGLSVRRERIPISVLSLGARVNGIIGLAKTTLNTPVPFARLVLRDPVTGRVEARAVADDRGNFTFVDVTPSGYVVELIGPRDAVFATSDVVTVGVGELREAIVRLADTREALGTFGTLAPAAEQPIAVAAQSGINAVTAPDRSVSPQR
jgi:hypothetical protein